MAIDTILPVSPVESDAYTHTDILPFTAFGQHDVGSLDLRVFEQDIYWVNIEGEPFYIDRISDEYVSNIITFLLNNADQYHLDYMDYAFSLATFTSYKTSLRSLFHGSDSKYMKTANEWLVSTKLMEKLIAVNARSSL